MVKDDMKNFIYVSLMTMVSLSAMCQETYVNANLTGSDLRGTARYVGMGGSMDALGADLSTVSSNPAGTAFFRRSAGAVTMGLDMQTGVEKFEDAKRSHVSFDQAGFVYSKQVNEDVWLNMALNYHQSKDLSMIVNAAGWLTDGSSQGRVSYDKGAIGGVVGLSNVQPSSRHPLGEEVYSYNLAFNQLDWLYYNSVVYNPVVDPQAPFMYHGAQLYDYGSSQRGFISDYDLNMSVNVHDRFYAGLTFGIKDVHYRNLTEYAELYGPNAANVEGVYLEDYRKIRGAGYDMALGVIVRPIDASPFRVGMTIKSPTFYDLKSENYTAMMVGVRPGSTTYQGPTVLDIENRYDFSLYTPWIFGLSVGHTIGKEIALGASVDYADYRYTNNRIEDNDDYYYYDYGYDDYTHADRAMNHNTKSVMRGVLTLKVGGEIKLLPQLAMRVGYNYVSPKYKSSGYKDGMLYSIGNNFMSTTDYTNWSSTQRVTAGLGYMGKDFSVDVAYQYSQTDGTFYPFHDACDVTNVAMPTNVSNKRHHVMMTLGCKF